MLSTSQGAENEQDQNEHQAGSSCETDHYSRQDRNIIYKH